MKEWKKPVLEILSVNQTMASTWWGPHDEAYQDNSENAIPHHGS